MEGPACAWSSLVHCVSHRRNSAVDSKPCCVKLASSGGVVYHLRLHRRFRCQENRWTMGGRRITNAGVFDRAWLRPQSDVTPYAEGNTANKLMKLERNLICLAFNEYSDSHAWRTYHLRSADRFDSSNPSDENEVPFRKNSNSRVHNDRHCFCDCWLNPELKPTCRNQAATIKLDNNTIAQLITTTYTAPTTPNATWK